MQTFFKSAAFRAAALGLSASLIVGCAGSAPTIDTSPEAEPTFDGLYPVKGGRMDGAWARPDFDVEVYSKIMLQGVGVEYRPGGQSSKGYRSTSREDFYEMTPEQKARFEAEMRDAFMDALSQGKHFEIVTEPGPDVLLVRAGLLDVVSYVPPEPMGNADIYLSRVGEATLVMEIVDSVSGSVLIRAVDRRAAEDSSGRLTNSNAVSNKVEARRVAKQWGGILRDGLDRFMAPGDEAGE